VVVATVLVVEVVVNLVEVDVVVRVVVEGLCVDEDAFDDVLDRGARPRDKARVY
jgi:hypothetical protein